MSNGLVLVLLATLSLRTSLANDNTPPFIVGIGTHSAAVQALDLLQRAGVHSVREDLFWSRVEKENGKLVMPENYELYVTALLQRQIEPLVILAYGNELYDQKGYPSSEEALEAFTRYCEFVVRHFQGRVHRYEIWNEWDHGCGMPKAAGKGTPDGYVTLIKRVYPRLKAIDPGLTILGAGLSDPGGDKGDIWLEKACQAGLLDHLDGVSFHPYSFSYPPERRIPENEMLRRCASVAEIVHRFGHGTIPLYVTEIGWPNQTGKAGSTKPESANYLLRSFLLLSATPNLRGVWWYDLVDDGAKPEEREHNFGVLQTDYSPKPAYHALQEVASFLARFRYVSKEQPDDNLHVLKYKAASGQWALAAWNEKAGAESQIAVTAAELTPGGVIVHHGTGELVKLDEQSLGTKESVSFKIGNTPLLIETGSTSEPQVTTR